MDPFSGPSGAPPDKGKGRLDDAAIYSESASGVFCRTCNAPVDSLMPCFAEVHDVIFDEIPNPQPSLFSPIGPVNGIEPNFQDLDLQNFAIDPNFLDFQTDEAGPSSASSSFPVDFNGFNFNLNTQDSSSGNPFAPSPYNKDAEFQQGSTPNNFESDESNLVSSVWDPEWNLPPLDTSNADVAMPDFNDQPSPAAIDEGQQGGLGLYKNKWENQGRRPTEQELNALAVLEGLPCEMIRNWFETNLRIDTPSPTPGPSRHNIDHVLDAVRKYAAARNQAPCGDNAHARKAKLDNQYKCLNCAFSSRTLDGLKRHMETKYPQEFWHCIECRTGENKPFICSRPDKICDHLRIAHDIADADIETKREESKVEHDAYFPNQCPFHNAYGRCTFKIGSWAAFVAHCAKHFRKQVADGPWQFRRNIRRPPEDEDPDGSGHTGSSGGTKGSRGYQQGSGSSSSNAMIAKGNRNGAPGSSNGYTSRCQNAGPPDNAVLADMQLTLRTSVFNVRVDQPNAVASRRPASLINVYDRSVVDPPIEAEYLALDYSLASKRCPHLKSLHLAHQTDQYTGLPVVKNFPAFFAEAIALTRDLGYRYLWIDLICEPSADYTRQLAVYEQANLIIVTCGSWAPPTHIWFFTCHFKSLRTVLSWTQDGQVAPSFSHVQHLGHGTYGVVDEVECRSTQDHFARKMFLKWKAGDKHQPTHLREIEMLRKLSHPNIARFVAAYFEKQTLNMLMQPVADCDLKDYLADPSRWSYKGYPIQRWFHSLASAVSYMHAASCRHKDIKPANILISGDDVLLSDFGIARGFSAGNSASQDGSLMTPKYCAPEIAKRMRRGRKADIFSLGCVFAELITADLGQTVTEMNQYLSAKSAHPSRRIIYCQHTNTMKSWLVGLYTRISQPYQRTVINLCIRMIDVDPTCRPSAAEICDILVANTGTISDKNLVHQIESLTRLSVCKSMCEPRMPSAVTQYHRIQVVGGLASSPLFNWDRTRNDLLHKYANTWFQRTWVLQEVALGDRRKKAMPSWSWASHASGTSPGLHGASLPTRQFKEGCRSIHLGTETPPAVILSIGTGRAPSTRTSERRRSAVKDSWDSTILTLDGGGIRGYSSLLILKQIMDKLQGREAVLSSACVDDYSALLTRTSCAESLFEQDLMHDLHHADPDQLRNNSIDRNGASKESLRHFQKILDAKLGSDPRTSGGSTQSKTPGTMNDGELPPCHYFDFMYGTSTGGLIATILARMRLSVTDALDVYDAVSRKIFSGQEKLSDNLREGRLFNRAEEKEVANTPDTAMQLCFKHLSVREYLLSERTVHPDPFDNELSRLCGTWAEHGLEDSKPSYEKILEILDSEAARNAYRKPYETAVHRTGIDHHEIASLILEQGLDINIRGAAETDSQSLPSWTQTVRKRSQTHSWSPTIDRHRSSIKALSEIMNSETPLSASELQSLLGPDEMLQLPKHHSVVESHSPGPWTSPSKSDKASHECSPHVGTTAPAYMRHISSYRLHDHPPQDTLSTFYHYKPLDPGGQEIRLLKLRPGFKDSPINAELQTFDLSSGDVPLYDALSYAWGEQPANKAISIEGRTLQVRGNVTRILKSLRNTSDSCYLWIDSICINQADATEMASSIAALHEIYNAASRVLVYLADDFVDDYRHPHCRSAQSRLQQLLHAFAAKRKTNAYFDAALGAFIFTENPPEVNEKDLRRWQRHEFDSQRSQEKLLIKIQCRLPALDPDGRNPSGPRRRKDAGTTIIMDGGRDADSAAALRLLNAYSRRDYGREHRHFSAHTFMALVFGISSLLLALSLFMASIRT